MISLVQHFAAEIWEFAIVFMSFERCVCVTAYFCVCLLCHRVCVWVFVCVYTPTVVFFQHLLVAHLSRCVIPHSTTHCSYFLQTEFTFSSNNSYMTELHTNHFSLAFSSSRCHIALIFFLFNCLEWNQNARDSERWTIEAHAVVLRVQHRKCIFFHYGTRFPAVDLHCALWPNTIISADSAALVARHWNLNKKKMRDRDQKK